MITSALQWEIRDRGLRDSTVDLRAEAVLAELLLAGNAEADDFVLMPNGGFGRGARRDVERLHPPGAMEWSGQRAIVEMNRLGLYDLLPEGLFHPVRRTRPFVNADDAVREVQHNNEVEKAARAFFLPLDHELLLARLQLELGERQLTAELLNDRTGRGVVGFWQPPAELSGEELGRLLMLLPHCHRITGSIKAMAKALSEILSVPVNITHAYVGRSASPAATGPALELATLGVDTVLHGALDEVERILRIAVGPVHPMIADEFAPGQAGQRRLALLLEYLCAADQRWEVEVRLEEAECQVQLEANGVSCRLGLSTVLN